MSWRCWEVRVCVIAIEEGVSGIAGSFQFLPPHSKNRGEEGDGEEMGE